jgi:hypothetical protein
MKNGLNDHQVHSKVNGLKGEEDSVELDSKMK